MQAAGGISQSTMDADQAKLEADQATLAKDQAAAAIDQQQIAEMSITSPVDGTVALPGNRSGGTGIHPDNLFQHCPDQHPLCDG